MSKQYPGGIISKTPVVPSGPYSNDTASGIWTLDQQAYWQKLGQWPTAGNNPVDPQFNYVTMLLHGDGTNGAQNNTFVDSSTNNFTITRNGNTTQGSFSPYGSNWSNYFNGTNAYLTPPTSSVVLGSSDFTVEYWLFAGNNNSHLNSASTAGGSFTFLVSSNADFYYGNGTSWENNIPFTSGTLAQNTWHHIAMTRQSSTMRLFLNGVLQGSASVSVSIPSNYWQIGAQTRNSVYLDGYISNFRIVSGTALYTSNFTPSTTPLTAVSGTSLLTCQSNRFVDNSASPLTITVNGTPSVQRFNPFGASTAYSTSVIGGSGYFDGSGDWLTVPDSPAWAFGSGDFTVELWYYPVSNTTTDIEFIGQWTSGSTDESWSIGHHWTNGLTFFWTTDGTTDQYLSSATLLTLSAWNHVAVSKSGTTVSLYLNGARLNTGTLTGSVSDSSRVLDIGGRSQSGANQIQGYLSDVRVVKGTAVYSPSSTTLTVPTAPLTAITNTQLLTSYTNGAIFDNAMMSDLETAGSAQILTSVKKYGTGSIYFNGTTSYLATLGQPIFSFGTGDFTIECWLNIVSFNGGVVIDFRPSGVNGDYITVYFNSSSLEFYSGSSGRITSGTLTTATWFHFALCRSGSSTKMFIDGTQAGSTYTASVNYTVGTKLGIGTSTFALGSSFLDGYIDEFRITKGYARYTANFTPPTAAFFNYGPT